MPAGCKCADSINQIVSQGSEVPPALNAVVVSAGKDQTAVELAEAKDGGRGLALGVQDLNGVLAKTYHASATAPTLLLVTGDGTLIMAPKVFHVGDRLESSLEQLHY